MLNVNRIYAFSQESLVDLLVPIVSVPDYEMKGTMDRKTFGTSRIFLPGFIGSTDLSATPHGPAHLSRVAS